MVRFRLSRTAAPRLKKRAFVAERSIVRAIGSVWFGSGNHLFQGGIIATGNHSVDFLEQKTENGENIAFLPSFTKPFLAWVLVAGFVEIREAYAELMLHAEDDFCVRFGPDGETRTAGKGQVICVLEQNYRRKDNDEP